jgi:APA family basic amino acid/polyamine antiporter
MSRALLLGLAIVTLTYMAVTMAFIAVVPIERVTGGPAVVAQVGELLLGRTGGAAVASVVVICVLGSLGATLMLSPRLYFAMARDGVFPAGAAALHPRFGTPARAIAIQAGLASLLVTLGTFETIVAYFVFVTVVFIALTVAAVFIERRRDVSFHVPGYPWTAIVFLSLVGLLLALLAANNPRQALLGAGVVALAFPVHRQLWGRAVPVRAAADRRP